jgi:diphosphomevalonate decarboxylase
VKYWGKKDETLQWPANSSLSMSLDKLHTQTSVTVIAAKEHTVFLNDKPVSRDQPEGKKIYAQLDYLSKAFNFTQKLAITTQNSFPTGCGIASSASGIAALTLSCLAAWTDAENIDDLSEKGFSREKLADLSRMGSGSAGRSLWGGYVTWDHGKASPDEQSIRQTFTTEHWQLCDSVVIFSAASKAVSSTKGHRLAWTSPLFEPRLALIQERIKAVTKAIESKDLDQLGPLLEAEALDMHAVMMSAKEPVFYFDKDVGSFLAWLRHLRLETGIPAYFTMDAGPNVHIIHKPEHKEQLLQHIHTSFPDLKILSDTVGKGPTLQRTHLS